MRSEPPRYDKRAAGGQGCSSDEARSFINALAVAVQQYGVSSLANARYLARVAKALGLSGRSLSAPNFVATVLWQDDENHQRLYFSPTRSGNYDLRKLEKVRELVDQVEARLLSPAEGLERLHAISQEPAEYGPVPTALAYVLCGAGFAGSLRASWLDALFAGLLSLGTYGIVVWASRSSRLAIATELVAAMLAFVLASVVSGFLPINTLTVTLCAVVWFVPGFGLTIAPYEMIYGSVLSGLVWLTNAVLALLKLLGGAAFGFALVQALWHPAPSEPITRLSQAWSWAFVPLLAVGLAILFRVSSKNLAWVILGALMTWAGYLLGEQQWGMWEGTFLGALILVVYANWCQRKLRFLSTAILLPDIMLLVPGSVSLRAIYLAATQGFLSGLDSANNAFILVGCILAGVLAGNIILPSSEEKEADKQIEQGEEQADRADKGAES